MASVETTRATFAQGELRRRGEAERMAATVAGADRLPSSGALPVLLQIPDLYPSAAVDAAVERLMGASQKQPPGDGHVESFKGEATYGTVAGTAGSPRAEDRVRQQKTGLVGQHATGTGTDGGEGRRPLPLDATTTNATFVDAQATDRGGWGRRFLVAGAIAVILFSGFLAWDRGRRLARRPPVGDREIRSAEHALFPAVDRESFTASAGSGVAADDAAGSDSPHGATSLPHTDRLTEPQATTDELFPLRREPSSDVQPAAYVPWETPSARPRTSSDAQTNSSPPAQRTSSKPSEVRSSASSVESRTAPGLHPTSGAPTYGEGGPHGSETVQPYQPRLLLPRVDHHENN